MSERAEPLVEVTRRDALTGREVVESAHLGHLVMVDATGATTLAIGDADHVTFPRSALKPLQAAVCLELIDGVDPELAASLSHEEIAIGWASHLAHDEHLAAVRLLAARCGLDPDVDPDALSCPMADGSRLAHNCSGKHALFALTAHALGLPRDREALLAHDGPLQSLILARLSELLGPPRAVGVDGCGAPALAVPLVIVARAFASLASEARFARVRDAGLAHPALIAGTARSGEPLVDTALLRAGVVAKRGAEGVLAAGWRTRDGEVGGVAAKAADGSMRGVSTAVVARLAALRVIPAQTWTEAAPTGGEAIAGVVRPAGSDA
jgi:L-asparaginase II